ncbi:MAG TPA: ABC transporter permease [Acidimicrobiales bacterium]
MSVTEPNAVIDRRPPGVVARITPLALLGGRHASRVLERNILVYRRSWIFIVSGFFEPLFYLLSIGVGLSHLVGPINVDGKLVPYTAFVAPGLLASSAMNGAMLDSTFLVFFKLKIAKTYDAMLSTPLGVDDVALGELGWCVLRGTLYSAAFLAIMAMLGYIVSPWAVLCWPAAILISLAFASAGMAGTTYMRTWQDFDIVSLAFIPLFLFSATFYPLTVYPGWLQAVVRCTPLYQGVVIVRAADLGIFSWALLGHIAYLVIMAIGGVMITRRRLGKLLLP